MNVKEEFDTVAAWGVTTAIAYLLTPYIGLLNITAIGLNYQIILMWTLFMIPPIYMSYKQGKGPLGWKSLNPIWAIFMLIGLLGNFAGQISLTGESLVLSYYHKWFLLPGALFIYTAYKMSDLSQKIYGIAAALNLAAVAALFLTPSFQAYAFQTAAVIQGLPMLVDWYTRKR